METADLIKALVLMALFGVFAPAAGFAIRAWPKVQRCFMGLMCFMTTGGIMGASEWGLTLANFEYRSHARGFHFYFIIFPALVVIFARLFNRWRDVKLIPPGFLLFYAFCVSASFSFFVAEYPTYVLMAAFKTVELTLVGTAVYAFLREERDLKFLLNCMAWTMTWQLFVVLKLKYVNHIYQVYGTFEHQNSLSTFTTMIGLVLLGVALGPKDKKSNWFLWAFIVCAAIVQSTLSRGSLAMFAVGTVIVILLSLFDRVTRRRVYTLIGLTAIAAIGLALTLDTIVARFHDSGNEESKRTRDMLQEAAFAMVQDHPLGVGWNNFGRMINHPYNYGNHIDDWQRSNGNPVDPAYQKGISESLYHLILAENGYLSLALFLLFIAWTLFLNLRAAVMFRGEFLGAFSIGMFAGCFVIYVQSYLERVLTQPRNMALWFLLLGAAAKIETWRREEKACRANPQEAPSQFEQNQLASLSEPNSYR